MYHFLSGYTAKVAGTEKGVRDPEATFSTCFGAPFMPRHPSVYGNLLRDLIARHHVDCWLVNTGWTGGKYGVGRRMPIRVTRRLLTAALDGSLSRADFRRDPYFGFAVPTSVPGVEPHILYPVKTWQDKAAFAADGEAPRRHVPARTSSASRPMSTRTCGRPRRRCRSRRDASARPGRIGVRDPRCGRDRLAEEHQRRQQEDRDQHGARPQHVAEEARHAHAAPRARWRRP